MRNNWKFVSLHADTQTPGALVIITADPMGNLKAGKIAEQKLVNYVRNQTSLTDIPLPTLAMATRTGTTRSSRRARTTPITTGKKAA